MQDAQAELSEVKKIAEPQEPQTEKSESFKGVTVGEVDELLTKTSSVGIPEEDKQQKLQKFLETVSQEEAERLNDINTRRLKELSELQPPEFKVTERHLTYTGAGRGIKESAEDLLELRKALGESQRWKKEWDSLTLEEKRLKAGRILELEGGTHTGKYIDEKGQQYSPQEAKKK